jgi:hypothetical protein
MKLEKKTIFYLAGGLLGGYLLCRFMASRQPIEFLGADGKPQRMARRLMYKWNSEGKVLLHSKRNPLEWRDTYLSGGDVFSLTGNSSFYQGVQYIETTITRVASDGLLSNLWIQSGSALLVG